MLDLGAPCLDSCLVKTCAARTYSEPHKWMRGKGRVTIQFGCCYNYAAASLYSFAFPFFSCVYNCFKF